jgi:hypothetical protein
VYVSRILIFVVHRAQGHLGYYGIRREERAIYVDSDWPPNPRYNYLRLEAIQ